MKRFFWVLFVMSLWGHLLMAQEKAVSGIVVSTEDGLPMIGVAVVDKQTMNGVTTNEKGEFSMTVSPRTKTLHLSYLGYKTKEVTISGRSMKIEMEPDMVAIDEVMVVAYGTGKKSTFTGSASVVKKESLEKIKASNVTQALQGQSSGVQVLNNSGEPGEDATIMIRGIGSMNASSSPLYVVDGTAYDGYLNAINPNDIESMTILKDASATALYGSRAANGVVMITTRKGASEKGQINFRSTWGFSSLAVGLPDQLSPDQLSQLTWRALYNGYLDSGYRDEDSRSYASYYVMGEFGNNPYNIDMPVGTDGKMDPDAKLNYWGDWRNALLKSRLRQEYTIDFSGKNKKADYFISAGYLNDKGVFSIQRFERYSTRANLNYNVNKWLKVGTNISLSHSVREGSASDQTVWLLRTMPTVYPIYEWDSATNAYRLDKNGNRIFDYGNYRTSWSGTNPLADDTYNKSPWTHDDVSNRTYFEITFIPGLKWRTNFSVDFYQYNYDGYVNSEYGFAAGYKGSAYKESDRNLSYTINNLLTYEKSFGDHSLSVLLGQEAYALEYKLLSAEKQGFPFPGVTEIGSAAVMSSMNSYTDKYRLLSWLSRVEYDYKDRYYISGSFRTDGSSRFHPDNRWGQFWSLGGSWRISNEEFMKPYSSWLDNLKLRASYGSLGNNTLGDNRDKDGNYMSQSMFAQTNYVLGRTVVNGLSQTAIANADLTWETTYITNIGVDYGLFGNRFSGSIEYFDKRTKGILIDLPAPMVHGNATVPKQNSAKVSNRGIEFTTSWNDKIGKDFSYNVGFNFTYIKNNVDKFKGGDASYDGARMLKEGLPIWSLYVLEADRIIQTDEDLAIVEQMVANNPDAFTAFGTPQKGDLLYKDVNGRDENGELTGKPDGKIDNDDRVVVGNGQNPNFTFGMNLGFEWKGIDFSMLFQGQAGLKDIFHSNLFRSVVRQGYQINAEVADGRWYEGRTDATYPRFLDYSDTRNEQNSTFWVANKNYLKIRNITLGYTLPAHWTQKAYLERVRIYGSLENFFTFTSWKGYDPEVSGVTYPTMRQAVVGVNVSF